jgi:hypothetical protein
MRLKKFLDLSKSLNPSKYFPISPFHLPNTGTYPHGLIGSFFFRSSCVSPIQAAVCHYFAEPIQIATIELWPPDTDEIKVQLGEVAISHSDIAFTDGA